MLSVNLPHCSLASCARPPCAEHLTHEAQSLLKSLLQKEPRKRLGSGPSGSRDVQGHPFFSPINWARLEARQVPSPFKPTIQHSESVENFDKIWTDLPPHDSPCPTPRDKAGIEVRSGQHGESRGTSLQDPAEVVLLQRKHSVSTQSIR